MSELSSSHLEPNINLAEVERQHQNLIRIVHNLYHAINARRGQEVIGKILAEVVTYTIYHFATEEGLMQQHEFPGFAAHRIEHNTLTLKILGLQGEHEAGRPDAAEGLLKLLQHWLEEHTLKRDKEYMHFLSVKGIA